jgi:hypothetical protein
MMLYETLLKLSRAELRLAGLLEATSYTSLEFAALRHFL